MFNEISFESLAFIYEQHFEEGLAQLIGDMPRVDEFIRGVEWVICRKPDEGQLAAGEPHMIYGLVCGLPGYPDIVVYYAVQGEHVRLLSIRLNGEEG